MTSYFNYLVKPIYNWLYPTPIAVTSVQQVTNPISDSNQSIVLNEGDAPSEPTIVLYFAKWCRYCTELMPEWEKFKDLASVSFPNVQVVSVNANEYSDHKQFRRLMPKIKVIGYPTIVFLKNNTSVEFSGERTSDAFMEFVRNNI